MPAALDIRRLVVFTLDGTLYGLRLEVVRRVLPAVEVTPLPKAPAIVLGVIDLAGVILPVVSMRLRFSLPERPLRLSDKLLVAEAFRNGAAGRGRQLALAVDSVDGVIDLSNDVAVTATSILPGLEHLEGVARTDGGLVLIHDLAAFLSLEEESALEAALRGAPG